MYCSNCGAQVNENAVVCIKCGCAVNGGLRRDEVDPNKSDKDWLTTLLLCFFLGGFGIHRFYTGHMGTAIIQLLTCGGCGIWALIDFITIAMGSFKDDQGKTVKNN